MGNRKIIGLLGACFLAMVMVFSWPQLASAGKVKASLTPAELALTRTLSEDQSALADSLQRLSSGLRINHASDDAQGLAIAARFESTAEAIQRVNGLFEDDAPDLKAIYRKEVLIEAQTGGQEWERLIPLFFPEEDHAELDATLSEIHRISVEIKDTLTEPTVTECTRVDDTGVVHEICCDNSIDDDGDMLTDCEDPDCSTVCNECIYFDDAGGIHESCCGNGVDDDNDGYADCRDQDCFLDPICCGPECDPR